MWSSWDSRSFHGTSSSIAPSSSVCTVSPSRAMAHDTACVFCANTPTRDSPSWPYHANTVHTSFSSTTGSPRGSSSSSSFAQLLSDRDHDQGDQQEQDQTQHV